MTVKIKLARLFSWRIFNLGSHIIVCGDLTLQLLLFGGVNIGQCQPANTAPGNRLCRGLCPAEISAASVFLAPTFALRSLMTSWLIVCEPAYSETGPLWIVPGIMCLSRRLRVSVIVRWCCWERRKAFLATFKGEQVSYEAGCKKGRYGSFSWEGLYGNGGGGTGHMPQYTNCLGQSLLI